MTKHDIQTPADVKILVATFYEKVRADDLLGPVFDLRIPEDQWPKHLDVLYNFWEAVIFGEIAFNGNPFPKHIGLGIQQKHFDRWIHLFHATIDDHFQGVKADEVKEKSLKMRILFEHKLKSIEETGMRPLI